MNANQHIESLEGRLQFSVSAVFSPGGGGVLTVIGDNLNNTINVSRDAAGRILVNGGAVAVQGGTPTVANTSLISVFGLGGNDTIALVETNGALPRSNLFGGAGNDVLTGGDANDQVFGESGNDRMIWNPGDDTDLNEGGAGTDTVEVNGGNGAETFSATANGARVRFDRLNPAPFSIDIGTSENLVLNANGGDDSFAATGNLAALIQLTVDGGAGNDTLLGSNGNDLLLGGDDNDFVDGQQGADVALMGAGNDVFQWDPGDGNDTVEGQDGADTMLFNGANVAENIDVSANGGRVHFFRNIANVTMDLNDTESIDFNALGGADTIVVNALAGDDVIDASGLDATVLRLVADGGANDDILIGSDGNDILDGGTGDDVLIGGPGTDLLVNGEVVIA